MNCVGCGCSMEGRKRKFCTKHCRWRYAARLEYEANPLAKTKEQYLAAVTNKDHSFTCEFCGIEAHRRMGGNSTRNRFCSMQCRKDQAKANVADQKVIAAQKAEDRRRQQAIDRLARLEAKAAIAKMPKPVAHCACGTVLHPRTRVCDACKQAKEEQYRKAYRKSDTYKAHKKADKTKRRAKESAVIHKVKPNDVFDRDKWKCQLCGCKTPKGLRGTYKDNAPELDHIISLAEGGDHTYANLQCACRQCNIGKGSKSRGQLGLSLH